MNKILQGIALAFALLTPVVFGVLLGRAGHGWWYLVLFVVFYILFGICEFLSIKTRKKSISKDIAEAPAFVFWGIVVSWQVLAIGLSVHWYLMR